MPLPFADFRRVENRRPQGASPELMDTIHLMVRRQAWLREEQIEAEVAPLEFVGSARLADNPATTGQAMRRVLGLADGWARAGADLERGPWANCTTALNNWASWR